MLPLKWLSMLLCTHVQRILSDKSLELEVMISFWLLRHPAKYTFLLLITWPNWPPKDYILYSLNVECNRIVFFLISNLTAETLIIVHCLLIRLSIFHIWIVSIFPIFPLFFFFLFICMSSLCMVDNNIYLIV